MTSYLAYRMAEFLSRALPMRTAYWVGLRIGDLFYWLDAPKRNAVVRNLQRVYAFRGIEPAEKNLTGMARKTFQYFGKYIVDFFRTARFTPDQIRRCVSFEHRERLEEAIAAGRGVIVVSAHFGNWEIAGAVLESLGYDLHVVVMPERLRKLEELLESHRRRRGFQILPLGRAARNVLRCLHRGDLVGMLADRDFTRHHADATFFGARARMPAGPVRLARRTGAPILPALLLRQEDDTFLFRFDAPIFPEREPDEASMQRRLCAFLEANIGERPYQWFIFDDYWAAA